MIEQNPFVRRIIQLALEEDLGAGDVTTGALVDSETQGKAMLIACNRLVLAGMPVYRAVYRALGSDVEFEDFFKEGDEVPGGSTVSVMTGSLSLILKGERTALNFLQRMSGIATLTRRFVDQAGMSRVRILDTRKTVPGHRWLDKYSVGMGGGKNHRFGLSDGILIKDNHIAAAGSISKAVELAKKNAPHTLRIEVEVEDLSGVKAALKAGADIILLDNMSFEEMTKAVDLTGNKALTEASGNMTLERISDVAKTGVDFISVGALTHSPEAADFSLEVVEL